MRHYWLTCDAPDLPERAFRKAFGGNAPATLEGGKGGDSPAPPDPYATAGAQTQMNQNTALYNRYLKLNNYSNPFGSQNTTQIGTGPDGAPIFQTNTTANPQLQGAMNGLFGQIGQSGSINQNALSGLSGLQSQLGGLNGQVSALGNDYQGLGSQLSSLNGQIGALGNDLNAGAAQSAQQQGQNAAYQAQTQYLDPQFAQRQESLDAQLANQGITQGSEAWKNAMTNFNNERQQAYSNAQNQAVLTGSQIGTQNWQNQLAGVNARAALFGQMGQNLGAQSALVGQRAGLFGQIGQNLGQQAGLYGQQVGIGQAPYSNLQTIAQMIPGYQGPATSAAAPADIAGAINNQYQAQLANHNADVASGNQTMSTVGSLAGMAAMAFMGF